MENSKISMADLKKQHKNIKAEIESALEEVISNANFIEGPNVKSFENEMQKYLNVSHAISCASGTDALHLDGHQHARRNHGGACLLLDPAAAGRHGAPHRRAAPSAVFAARGGAPQGTDRLTRMAAKGSGSSSEPGGAIFVISDGTGETAAAACRAVMLQFSTPWELRIFGGVRHPSEVRRVM